MAIFNAHGSVDMTKLGIARTIFEAEYSDEEETIEFSDSLVYWKRGTASRQNEVLVSGKFDISEQGVSGDVFAIYSLHEIYDSNRREEWSMFFREPVSVADLRGSNQLGVLLAGSDTITGFEDNDILFGGTGNNVLSGQGGDDVLMFGGGNETFSGGTGNDTLSFSLIASGVARTLAPQSDIENLTGSHFADTFEGNDDNNRLSGGQGDDVLLGAGGMDKLAGDDGNDILRGGGDNDRIEGGTGSDAMDGNGGDDRIAGDDGDDILRGGSGKDQLTGGRGADRLTGNSGPDKFIFTRLADSTVRKDGRDTIVDFDQAEGDRIDLKAIDARTGSKKDNAFTFIGKLGFQRKSGELRSETNDSGTFIYGDVNGDGVADFSLKLEDRVSLKAEDFVL